MTVCRDVILEILDTLVGRVLAIDVYGDRDPLNTYNVYDGSKIRSSLNLSPGAQVEHLRYAKVTNLLCSARCHSARSSTAEDAATWYREGWVLGRCIATDVAKVEDAIDGDEGGRGRVHW